MQCGLHLLTLGVLLLTADRIVVAVASGLVGLDFGECVLRSGRIARDRKQAGWERLLCGGGLTVEVPSIAAEEDASKTIPDPNNQHG